MGCFHTMGFHSRLPITYGDDIVLIICTDSSEYVCHNSPCYSTDYLKPLFLPIKGKYDDYGSIEKYDSSEGTVINTIEKIVDTDIKTFLDGINRFGEYTLDELENIKDKYKNNKEFLTYYKSLKNILNSYGNEYINMEETRLFYLIERREVYDTMVSLFKKENEKKILEIIKYRNKKKISGFPTNTNNFFNEDTMFENEELTREEKRNIARDYKNKLFHLNLLYSEYFCMCEVYNKLFFTTEYEINELIDFLLFHSTLNRFCGRYTQSQNGGQSVTAYIKELIKLNNIYTKSLKSLNEKYDYDDE